MTITFEDEALYVALMADAERTGADANQIVVDAVREWLEAIDEERVGLNQARAEWERDGGVEAGQFFDGLRGEPAP